MDLQWTLFCCIHVGGCAKKLGRWLLLVKKAPSITQRSVTMQLKCDMIFNGDFTKNLLLSPNGGRILTRAQQLLRWATVWPQ